MAGWFTVVSIVLHDMAGWFTVVSKQLKLHLFSETFQ